VPVTVRKPAAPPRDRRLRIKRLDFKIGDGDWKDTSMVANEVQ
jgi:hypothetical protein